MNPPDTIEIRKLRVSTRIGVPDEERAEPQELHVSVAMTPVSGFDDLDDDIAWTVDYFAVAQELKALAAERPRCLIETLALDFARHLLEKHPLKRAEVVVEKFILPDTECVAVRVVRER